MGIKMEFTWKILSITSEAKSVEYLLSATDGINTVETKGSHSFLDGTVNILFDQIKEQNLIDWLENDHSKDDVNGIKQNLLKQLEDLKQNQKVEFPWLANTFTI